MVVDPPLSDKEFEEFCRVTDNVRIERTREGVIQVNAPAGGQTGSANALITARLFIWWMTHQQGSVFDSNTGFYLPDGSMLSPDASYVTSENLRGVALEGFPRLCPDFVMELRSKSDALRVAKEKMQRWIENGVALGWLVNPPERKVYVYSPHPGTRRAQVSTVTGKVVTGRGPVEGFVLDLEEVWARYQV
jgi:Uma2 family endonuclease